MKSFDYTWGIGFSIIMGLVLLVVIVYTIVMLRKQANEKEASENVATKKKLDNKSSKGSGGNEK